MLICLRCLRLCIAAAMGWLLATSAHAQAGTSVYRCGSHYSDAPCTGGAALVVDDARTAAQRQQTLAAQRQDQQLATRLAAERRARAQATIGQQAARIGPSAAERARADALEAKARAKAAAKRKTSNKPRKLGAG